VSDLRWSWLAAPYLVCATVILAVGLGGALVRGDRVLRLGVVGAAITALPWAVCQAAAACTDDPSVALRLLRLGQGPLAMVGPNLMLVLLGVSGQLERYRWIARIAGIVGLFFMLACWTTTWTAPSVRVIPSGMFYVRPGPLTGIHASLLVVWLIVGLVIVRRAAPQSDRKRAMQMVIAVLGCCALGAVDSLLLYDIWGVYPVAWFSATVAGGIALYLVARTDFLRPQGFDRALAIELLLSLLAFAILGVIVWIVGPSLGAAVIGAVLWAALSGIAWSIARARPVRVTAERELEQFAARVVTLEDEATVAERLGALWRGAIEMSLQTLWWRDGDAFVSSSGARWTVDADVQAWLVHNTDAVAQTDLATMRLGAIRTKLEAFAAEHRADVIVPLVDRDQLVGIAEASHAHALRESDRSLVADSARAAARALTFAGLARTASRERETAREVEIADALRLQAAASRDAELGRWAVAVEYRPAPRTTGAGWSATELGDGRLALLATEAQAHGVAAALATAALTGAFAAATAGGADVTLADLITALRASSEGVIRGGEPVAAFLAILDAKAQSIEYACAGHPGAFLVGPIAAVESGLPLGSVKRSRPEATPLDAGTREPGASLVGVMQHKAPLPPDTLVVVASGALRGTDDEKWCALLREVAPASGRLASVLVDGEARRGEPAEDLLAVVVRAR
jgi:GAF domain-containing protein